MWMFPASTSHMKLMLSSPDTTISCCVLTSALPISRGIFLELEEKVQVKISAVCIHTLNIPKSLCRESVNTSSDKRREGHSVFYWHSFTFSTFSISGCGRESHQTAASNKNRNIWNVSACVSMWRPCVSERTLYNRRWQNAELRALSASACEKSGPGALINPDQLLSPQ